MKLYQSPEAKVLTVCSECPVLSGTASASNEQYSVEQEFDPFEDDE